EPEKKVIVRMAMTRKRELAIQITDQGVGMSEDEIQAANARLADPPDLDVAVTRRMGLYVVARLAKRHGIIVRLRDNEDIEGGLIARINVPADLVQPVGAPSRSMSATSTTSSLAATSDVSTSTNLPVRNSGIAGAFTGGMPRLRQDGSVGEPGQETRQDRTPEEVAGYPAFRLGYDQGGPATAANGVPTEQAPPTEQVPPGQNGRHDDQHTVALFGNPMPDPGPATEVSQPPGGYPPLGAGRPADDAELNVDAPTERLPIYEAVLSQWFEAADTGSHQRQPAAPAEQQAPAPVENGNGSSNGTHAAHAAPAAEAPPPQREPDPTTSWTSPGDDGWLAAQALLETTPEAQTTAGLPKRVPKAHLVPGSAAPRHAASAAETPAAPPLPPRTADAVRGRMSSFQQGVRRGRHALIEAYAGDQSGPEDSRKDEEQE
ncbi:MAG TPA: ATP-binding protein, partial [Actinophytocola sp.]|nr:ATP-binding protein [Actinophytocola sp.]